MEWNESLIVTKKWVIFIISAGIILGYLADISNVFTSQITAIPNLISILITLAANFALIGKIINTRIASVIVVYTLALNIILSTYVNNGLIEYYEADILRSTLFFGLLMTIAGFVNGKLHLFIIGCFCTIWFISVLIISKNKFLLDNAAIIFMVILGYTLGLYFLFKMLESNVMTKNKLIVELKEKSNELENSNQLLTYEKALSEAQKDELKSLIESREKLFSIISHDIKNPLAAIISFSELINSKIAKNDFVKATEFNKIIHESSTNLYRLLINLLDWSKMQSGSLIVTPEWIDINQHIKESIEIFATLLEEKQIKLEIRSSEKDKIFVDKNMLTTIIRNLYSNALKYTRKNGNITIDSKIENNQYFYTITDSGMGIESTVVDRILKSKEGFTTTGTNGEMGTGLGLVLCKEFIQLHHGNLSISSKPGVGSVFSFSIPAEYQVQAKP